MSSGASGRSPIFLLFSNSMNLRPLFPLQLFRSVFCGAEEIADIEVVG